MAFKLIFINYKSIYYKNILIIMGCGCHSAKKAQPVRQARRTVPASTNATTAMIRNTYAANLNKKRIIRRSINH